MYVYVYVRDIIGEIMQSITVNEKNSNIKIENYIQAEYPTLSYSTLQRAFRKRDIKANGSRVGRDYIVKPGDILEIYIVDELLTGSGSDKGVKINMGFSVVYEDDNILLVNKEQGIPVHPDREQSQHTLIDLVRKYLREKSEHPLNDAHFQPELCHRLDRNTGGLVIIAKNQASLHVMLEKLEAREVKKYYQCLVKGNMEKPEAQLKAYLWKDANKSRVFVSEHKKAGSLEIITNYKVIEYNPAKDFSRLEVELVTGRTHQIRAHLAFIGHPVIGDGKYGTNAINRSFGFKQQALWACRLRFTFAKSGSHLDYLSGKVFSIQPAFVTAPFRQ